MAEWATAVVAAGALAAAVVAARVSWRVLQIELDRDSERREVAERAAQADSVAAWATTVDHEFAELTVPRSLGAVVRNASSLPVYNLVVTFIGPDGTDRARITVPVFPPGEDQFHCPIEPRRPERQDDEVPVYAESFSEFAVALTFRDTAGRTWVRDQHGQLAKASPNAGSADSGQVRLP